jgi:hypothetical protein
MQKPTNDSQRKRLTMISYYRRAIFAMAIVTTMLSLSNEVWGTPVTKTPPDQIVGKTYRLERTYLVSVHVPSDSVDKVLQALAAAVGLEYGRYDQVAYIDAEGLEQYRPIAGSKAGTQEAADTTPSKVVTVSLDHDEAVLKKAVDEIHHVHPYEEPVIYVIEGWRSRSTSSDPNNPNRWWNQETK